MTRFDILRDRGLIRELHVYGNTTAVDTYDKGGCQHTGIGKGLLQHAEIATMEHGLYGIVVISGEGVKGYYEKRGYREVDTFMVKDFPVLKVWYYYLQKKYSYLVVYIVSLIGIFVTVLFGKVLKYL